MAIRISISFRETFIEDIKILKFLETRRSKSIYIKELISQDMKKEKIEELKEKKMIANI